VDGTVPAVGFILKFLSDFFVLNPSPCCVLCSMWCDIQLIHSIEKYYSKRTHSNGDYIYYHTIYGDSTQVQSYYLYMLHETDRKLSLKKNNHVMAHIAIRKTLRKDAKLRYRQNAKIENQDIKIIIHDLDPYPTVPVKSLCCWNK